MNALAAAVAFFAFGAVFLGTALLLLFNPRSRSVRWYAAFQVVEMIWLGLQGWAFASGRWDEIRPWHLGAVHLLPHFFAGFALVEALRRPTRDALAVVALGFILLLPFVLHFPAGGVDEWVMWLWNLTLWTGASLLMARRGSLQEHADSPAKRRLGLLLATGFLAVLVLGWLGGLLTDGAHAAYALPLAMVWIQVLLLVGIAHLRYYDIDVRVARTGELAANAAEQERLAVLGELSASLAHEIRNPLTGVRSLAQQLTGEVIDEERRRRYAAVILEETGRVERLVANLLDLARRQPPMIRGGSTPLNELFADLLLLVGFRAERAGVRLTAHGDGLHAPVRREALAQALLNLLLNAIRHSPPGGTVSLLARPGEDAVELLVRDQGAGVPIPEREWIWAPFRGNAGSTGLGLAVVRRIAGEAGWAVEVGEAPGGGAEFRIRIPTHSADERRKSSMTPSSPQPVR